MVLDALLHWIDRRENGEPVVFLILATTVLVSVIGFCMYAPFTYGFRISREWCNTLKLQAGWDWDCIQYNLAGR